MAVHYREMIAVGDVHVRKGLHREFQHAGHQGPGHYQNVW